jgi:hypothetical protein
MLCGIRHYSPNTPNISIAITYYNRNKQLIEVIIIIIVIKR